MTSVAKVVPITPFLLGIQVSIKYLQLPCRGTVPGRESPASTQNEPDRARARPRRLTEARLYNGAVAPRAGHNEEERGARAPSELFYIFDGSTRRA